MEKWIASFGLAAFGMLLVMIKYMVILIPIGLIITIIIVSIKK